MSFICNSIKSCFLSVIHYYCSTFDLFTIAMAHLRHATVILASSRHVLGIMDKQTETAESFEAVSRLRSSLASYRTTIRTLREQVMEVRITSGLSTSLGD